ncbi:hypothetical protein CCAX7_51700 [Capsulimonas corticalis]|uniref:Polysaccharide biosynthesis protein C-terminal domain-containing protein n=1 Tax=Capsulimonas corticalis TaxID=2219043 RepID=A0A9N7LA44_9BACT|nr:oligosaccharide flippase family protein [Capsulimonas corticalis]BDI33119.1 hypothetical protein CCAX7_51700 [Capsulimonas corticalis]
MRSLRNTALNLFTSLGMNVIQLGIGVILARTLGPYGNGERASVLLWPLMLSWACGLSFGQANAYLAASRPELRASLFANSIWMALIVGLPFTALAVTILPHFVHLTVHNRALFLFSMWMLPVSLLSDYLGWLIYGGAKFGKFSLFRIAPQLVTVIALLGFWAFHCVTVQTAILSTWAGSYTALAFALVTLVRDLGWRLRPDWGLVKQSLDYAWRVHLGTLANTANGRLDQLLMTAMVSPQALGLYVFAVTFSELLHQCACSISMVLFPKVAAETDSRKQAAHAAMSVRWTLIIGIVGGSALYLIAPVLVPLVWGHKFAGSVPAIYWLLPGVVALGVGTNISAALRAAGKPMTTSTAEAASLVVMCILLLTLLPRWGIVGASIASTCGYFVNLFVLIYYFAREFGKDSIASMRPSAADLAYARTALVNIKSRKNAAASEAASL